MLAVDDKPNEPIDHLRVGHIADVHVALHKLHQFNALAIEYLGDRGASADYEPIACRYG